MWVGVGVGVGARVRTGSGVGTVLLFERCTSIVGVNETEVMPLHTLSLTEGYTLPNSAARPQSLPSTNQAPPLERGVQTSG